MLDIKLIREKPEEIKAAIARKGAEPALIDELLELDARRRDLIAKVERYQTELNVQSKEIAQYHGQQKIDAIKEASESSGKIGQLKPELDKVEAEYKKIIQEIPNIPSDDTPDGPDVSGNVVLRRWGEKPKFDFKPLEHFEIGENLGIIDIQRATKISGSRFSYLKGDLVLLQNAILNFAYSVLTSEEKLKEIAEKAKLKVSSKPFLPVIPPVFIKPEPFERMGRIEPKEERYYIESDDLFLIGSAEHTLGSMHMDETFQEKDLPVRYAGYSLAFRREAGSYGKDMKGIIRVHQFDKLELESFTKPADSIIEQNFIIAIQEYLMQELKIPYQIVQICTGDMGGPDFRQIDLESWLPGQNKYRETHTSDNMTDYQSRRLNTKYKSKDGKSELVHMNDATAFAMGRTMIAILENYQQADGSVKIPEVLQQYTKFVEIKHK